MTGRGAIGLLTTCLLLGVSRVAGASVELPSGARFFKVYVAASSSRGQFDATGAPREFLGDGRGSFTQAVAEVRWAFAHRWNIGYRVPFVENTFSRLDGDAQRRSDRRSGITDLSVLAERRYLTLPDMLSIEAEVALPTGYDTDRGPWLGNGARTVLAGLSYKRLFAELPYARLWVDGGVAVRRVFGTDPGWRDGHGNLDGRWAVPFNAGINARPVRRVTLVAGVVGARNSDRRFLVAQAGAKYRPTYELEIELLVGRVLAGRSSSTGRSVLLGVSFYSSRLWE